MDAGARAVLRGRRAAVARRPVGRAPRRPPGRARDRRRRRPAAGLDRHRPQHRRPRRRGRLLDRARRAPARRRHARGASCCRRGRSPSSGSSASSCWPSLETPLLRVLRRQQDLQRRAYFRRIVSRRGACATSSSTCSFRARCEDGMDRASIRLARLGFAATPPFSPKEESPCESPSSVRWSASVPSSHSPVSRRLTSRRRPTSPSPSPRRARRPASSRRSRRPRPTPRSCNPRLRPRSS